jgi:VWFA-related protein
MKSKLLVLFVALAASINVFPQDKPQTASQGESTIRISAQLIQLDCVVTDKDGKVVKGLNKGDFELLENGRKQDLSFFEFVDATGGRSGGAPSAPSESEKQAAVQGPGAADVRRIFAFVIDDLTIRPEDTIYVRELLTNFVDNRMQPSDLVAIVRVVGGESLLQQFTNDKDMLRRVIAKLTPRPNPLNIFTQYDDPQRTTGTGASAIGGPVAFNSASTLTGDATDINGQADDSLSSLRSFVTLGTAAYMIDGMKELPGRKAMVLVSGGLPSLGSATNTIGNVSYFLNQLADKATRSGVAINTLDVRGLSAQSGVASFEDTPAKSAMSLSGGDSSFGRVADKSQFGDKNPFDTIDAHMGLRELSNATGGIAVLNRNDFNKGLDKIVETNDGYYLLAYTPLDSKFNGEFRKVEIKVKGAGYKVLSRRGYVAREEPPPAAPETKEAQLLAAIKSPLAKRDLGVDAALFYAPQTDNKTEVGIGLSIDVSKLKFQAVGDKQEADYDVAGFVYDEFGKMRGGFSETEKASLTPEQLQQAKVGGLPYSKGVELPPGIYQIRLAVRDNNTGAIGTTSKYLEVPDITKGRLAASSLLMGGVEPGLTKAGLPATTPNRAFSRKQDLRYAVIVYNPKLKDGQSAVSSQVIISKDGKVLFREPAQPLKAVGKPTELVKVGQVGLAKVPRGRYTLTVAITDTLADKKAPQVMIRSGDFVVVD